MNPLGSHTSHNLGSLLLASVCALAIAGGLSCSKRCETAEGCKRSCQCADDESGTNYACAMVFNCDQENSTCMPGHDQSCEEICAQYAATRSCGRQCTSDEHCMVRCTCQTTEGSLPFSCSHPFACDQTIGVCDEYHRALGDDCNNLCGNPAYCPLP